MAGMRALIHGFVIVLLGSVLTACAAPLAMRPDGQRAAVEAPRGGYRYLLYTPQQRGRGRLPLLIFLHGSGERGDNLDLVTVHGPPHLAAGRSDYPFIVLSPQLEAGGTWDVDRLEATLADARRRAPVDPDRILLTGLSLGGHGSWAWAVANPRLFAAVAPIAGWGDTGQACALRDLPVWAVHGDADNAVPPAGSTAMVRALEACGPRTPPRLSLYPGVGHDSWTQTYADPAFNAWLLAQRRSPAHRR